jgi:hypothetical protein
VNNRWLVYLTPLEQDVLRGIYESDYADGGPRPDVWAWSLAVQVATPRQIPGVVSSLVKKGLVKTTGTGEEGSIYVTELGQQAAAEIGVKEAK